MKQIILGTSGHIDHGKTSLIKAMTGTDTDRLKEEKLRGITIELGFASLDLPGGYHLGIVDVPGHEKFVKNMVAGATGIDLVAMVIAADEGVMPQTREHLEICSLLEVHHGLVVLTKIDMVDEEWLELVQEDVRDFVTGTFLEGTPIVPVSSMTGQGIPELLAVLDACVAEIPDKQNSGLFRLPVDRVFTMKGFGTVITGSLVSGKVRVGDTIMLYPSGVTSKVRGIQVHNQSVDEAGAGMRTAINFQGLEKSVVQRGDVLAQPGSLKNSYMVDIVLQYLASNPKPLKNRVRVRFHTGTSEIMGNLILLDRETLEPGDRVVAQMRLDAPVALVKDDRFVIRSYSPVRTVGGGSILNPIPAKHKRFRQEVVDALSGLNRQLPEEIAAYHALQAGIAGVTHSDLKIMTNLSDKALEQCLGALLSKKALVQADKEQRRYIHGTTLETLIGHALDLLAQFHRANPLKAGMSREELKFKLSADLDNKLYTLLLNQLQKDKRIIQEADGVRLADHKVSLQTDQDDMRKKILETYRKAGLTPPYFKDLVASLDLNAKAAKEVLVLLVEMGEMIKVKEGLYFHKAAVDDLQQRMVDFFKQNEEMSTPQFKEIASVSRKYLIPLLEYFDTRNITLRVGDMRRLR